MKIENWKLKSNTGFTIVELIVCVGIISVISGAVFWNGRSFNDKTALASVAQDVALAMRQAQNYGASVRETSTGSSVFTAGYGIVFDSASPSQVIIFVDSTVNNQYDGTSACTGECVEKIVLRNGVTIKSSNGIGATTYAGATSYATPIYFTFIRPSLNATIKMSGVTTWASGSVVLQSPQGNTKTITMNAAGQVSVQ